MIKAKRPCLSTSADNSSISQRIHGLDSLDLEDFDTKNTGHGT